MHFNVKLWNNSFILKNSFPTIIFKIGKLLAFEDLNFHYEIVGFFIIGFPATSGGQKNNILLQVQLHKLFVNHIPAVS